MQGERGGCGSETGGIQNVEVRVKSKQEPLETCASAPFRPLPLVLAEEGKASSRRIGVSPNQLLANGSAVKSIRYLLGQPEPDAIIVNGEAEVKIERLATTTKDRITGD